MYRTRHSLYLGAELELYVEQHSDSAGYWLGVRDREAEDPTEIVGYTAVTLHTLRSTADSMAAVVARLEREERL